MRWKKAAIEAALAVVVICPVLWLVGGVVAAAAPTRVTATQLIEHSDRYDNRRVVYRGEAVGDILPRGDQAWVAVNDDHYSKRPRRRYEELKGGNTGMGVYAPGFELAKVKVLGSYEMTGDLVEVRGTFYRSNPAHGGDMCIVADEVTVLKRGFAHKGPGIGREWILAAVLLAACLALGGYMMARRKAGLHG